MGSHVSIEFVFSKTVKPHAVNEAYQFSSLTSVTLLYCWTIVWAILLTWFFLRTSYSVWQLVGAALSVVGLSLVMLSDARISGGGKLSAVTI